MDILDTPGALAAGVRAELEHGALGESSALPDGDMTTLSSGIPNPFGVHSRTLADTKNMGMSFAKSLNPHADGTLSDHTGAPTDLDDRTTEIGKTGRAHAITARNSDLWHTINGIEIGEPSPRTRHI